METNKMDDKYFLPAAVIVAGLFIAGAVVWNDSRPASVPTGAVPTVPSEAGGAPSVVVDIKKMNVDGRPFIGQANARTTIVFWGDFQCSFCKKFEFDAFPQIIKEYVDTGKVKVVFMDFVFLGDDSVTGALYSHSIWKLYPNQYLAWRTAMYMAQDGGGDQGFGDAASIDTLNATISGIDAAKVAADLKANTSTYQKAVDDDHSEAQKAGVSATPAVLIGTQVILGAYPFSNFKTALDAVIK